MKTSTIVTIALLCLFPFDTPAHPLSRATLVVDGVLDAPARHGLAKLERALRARGFSVERSAEVISGRTDLLILAGLSSSRGPAANALKESRVALPEGPEALVIRRTEVDGTPTVVLCGSDARGLMYAALDAAERISWSEDSGDPFAHLRDTAEEPYVSERAVSIYTMQRAWFESRLYDETYWQRYFDMLAESRINSFVVIFGYENGGFMAPPYPYFFDVDGFPDVELTGITTRQQERNVAAFNQMIQAAHDRGVDVVVAIWDHIYRGGVQSGGIAGASENAGQRIPGLVWGVTAENLAPYSKAALSRLLEVFPTVDAIQFRMHGESGLERGEMEGFWHEVFGMVKRMRPDLRVDVRAKELPDAIIEDGLSQGLDLRVTTKYWMEQMGLPFHPTHINRQNQHDRRHGYADLLGYPQRYKVHWRLWTGGTTRLLLWGDPDYVRRFAASTHVYEGDSFEVNEMLATKMLGEPHDAEPIEILDRRYRYYDYEFERYWHYYQVWGRVSYDPETASEVWEREFQRRFGREAGMHLMEGLHLASKVLPRIVAGSYRYQLFPTTRGWAGMMRMGDLPDYAGEQGSDIQQFLNVRDQAHSVIEGTDTAMRRPAEASRWFERIAEGILEHVTRAEQAIGDKRGNEFLSTLTDLKILANLAKYHSRRLPAGVQYNLYEQTGDLFALEEAIRHEARALEAWQQLVEAAGDIYNENLAFGVHRVGFSRHWQEELDGLRQGLRQLEAERRQVRRRPWSGSAAPRIAHVPVRRIGAGEPLVIRATVAADREVEGVRVLVAEEGQDYSAVAMRQVAEGMYSAEVPLGGPRSRIKYVIEAVGSGDIRSVYPAPGKAAPVEVTITDDREAPTAQIDRIDNAEPGQNLEVTATVTDPSGVEWVRLRYRHLTQLEDYRALEMTLDRRTGLYQAEIPADFLVPEWDLMYFVEALDTKGNGRSYPDLEHEMPYVIVRMER